MDIYDDAVSDEKKQAHRGVIRQVTRRNRSVTRSAPNLPSHQPVERSGVPDQSEFEHLGRDTIKRRGIEYGNRQCS